MVPSAESPKPLAAVDLGSNSFHMVVAEERQGELVVLDRLRERVGLAEGLTPDGPLKPEVAQRALDCLQRFGDRLKGIPEHRVRAVGTATFRDVKDGRAFRKQAQINLGHEIETLPGKEEARLIYLGVAHSLGDDKDGRLVIDIGGGSTEIIVGKRFATLREASVSLGCIYHSQRFFAKGLFTRGAFRKAILDARLELQPISDEYAELQWKQVVGASGTILAVEELIAQHCPSGPGIRPDTLDELIDILCEAGSAEALDLAGLAEDRRTLLAGGLAIMKALCEQFEIKHMDTASGALREGLLYHLLGRLHHEDVRHRSVSALAERFHSRASMNQAIWATADKLYEAVKEPWKFKRRHRRYLRWSCALLDVGMAVSFSGYHRHGAYIISNSDMPGFSSERQEVLAELVRCQRKRVRASDFDMHEGGEAECLQRLSLLIRISRRLHRVLRTAPSPDIQVHAKWASLRLVFPKGWLDENALIQEDLLQESDYMVDWKLQLDAQ